MSRALRIAVESDPRRTEVVFYKRKSLTGMNVIIDYKVGNLHNLKNALDFSGVEKSARFSCR